MVTKVPVPVEGLSVGTAMLVYTGIGASSAVVPLVLIGLGLLITTRFKKRGEANRDVTGQYRHVRCSSSSQCVNDAYLWSLQESY